MSNNNAKEKVHIGTVTGQVGLRGEIKIFHFADSQDILKAFDYIIVDDEEYIIENIRYKKKIPIIKLANVDDREAAEALDKKEIFRYADDKADLPLGSYYIKDLVGMNVVTENEEVIGTLKNVVSGKAQDIYEIELDNNKILPIPAVDNIVIKVDVKDNKMKVNLPDGIEELIY